MGDLVLECEAFEDFRSILADLGKSTEEVRASLEDPNFYRLSTVKGVLLAFSTEIEDSDLRSVVHLDTEDGFKVKYSFDSEFFSFYSDLPEIVGSSVILAYTSAAYTEEDLSYSPFYVAALRTLK